MATYNATNGAPTYKYLLSVRSLRRFMNEPAVAENQVQSLNQLLATKIHIPCSFQSLVPRPRLLERLNQGMERKLILLSAPAGFGKTTLLCEWLQSEACRDIPVAWISLDEGDTDPVH
jgi:ATP/maltotriose-dependent transcriptional regulator MalT